MSRVSGISSINYPSMKRFGIILLGLAALAAPLTPASAVVTLYNNSNITTGVGNGLNGANTSAIASVDSTYGFTENGVTLTYALADDFTLSMASQVTQVTFDAYSTSTYPSPPTSPFTAATVSIWNAQPGTAGATVLFTSSTLAATAWTGVYRVTSTTLTNAQRPVFTLSVSFNNVPLVAGSYWASWSVTGVGSPGLTASIFNPPLMNTDGTHRQCHPIGRRRLDLGGDCRYHLGRHQPTPLGGRRQRRARARACCLDGPGRGLDDRGHPSSPPDATGVDLLHSGKRAALS